MIGQANLPFYYPHETWLHQLHIQARLGVCGIYTILLFTVPSPVGLAVLLILLAGLTAITRLPVRGRIWIIFSALFLVGIHFFSYQDSMIGRFIFSMSKILGFVHITAIMSMTTRLPEMLGIFQLSKGQVRWLIPGFYVVNTILAIFPSIQYDLMRAIDAESVRLKGTVRFYYFESWIGIISVVIVRVLNRAERFTDTVLNRGFSLDQSITLLQNRPIRWRDLGNAALILLPGILIWGVSL